MFDFSELFELFEQEEVQLSFFAAGFSSINER